MSGISALPAGTLSRTHLRVLEAREGAASVPHVTVVDQSGAEFRMLRLPGADDATLTPGRWYRFRDLVRPPELSDGWPACPACAARLDAEGCREVAEMVRGLNATPVVFATSETRASPLDADDWLPPVANTRVDPFRWRCPDCGFESPHPPEPVTQRRPAGTLPERIRTALSSSDRGGWGTSGYRPPTQSFRTQVLSGGTPTPDQLTFEAVRSPYEDIVEAVAPTGSPALAPTVDRAVSTDPSTGERKRFCDVRPTAAAVGLARDRPALNLVLAIDVSGSMAAPFQHLGGAVTAEDTRTKLAAVDRGLTALLDRLDGDDAVGVVVFDAEAEVVRPLGGVTDASPGRFHRRMQSVVPGGDTNPLAGYRRASDLFQRADRTETSHTENRILLVSDSLPVGPGVSTDQFRQRCVRARERGVHTSVVGLDFPRTDTARRLCRVPGANVALARDADGFRALCTATAGSLLFPVAYEFTVEADVPAGALATPVPSDAPLSESVFRRETVFPSGPTAQSLDSLPFELADTVGDVQFRLSWTDADGDAHAITRSASMVPTDADWFDSDAIRLHVALLRYLRTLQRWARRERDAERGIATGPPLDTQLTHVRDALTDVSRQTGTQTLRRDIDVVDAVLARL